jgi:hypothetical protein
VLRLILLGAALPATTLFVVLRNRFDLEDSRFIVALVACSLLSLTLSLGSELVRKEPGRRAVLVGLAGFLLVPVLYATYLVVFTVSVCIVGGQRCYS